MIRPDDLWEALDALALEQGLTPSGLARAAGLDPTTFNPSRRFGAQGDMRWMALPSLLRALDCLKISPAQFMQTLEGQGRGAAQGVGRRVRGLPLSRLYNAGLFDKTGHPTGGAWENVTLPCAITGNAYAVRVDTDAMEPYLRSGSSLVVMPDIRPRQCDRVLLVQPDKKPIVGLLSEEKSQTETVSQDGKPSSSFQKNKNGSRLDAPAESRWVIEPYAPAGQGGGSSQHEGCSNTAPVGVEKANMLLHRIVMVTF